MFDPSNSNTTRATQNTMQACLTKFFKNLGKDKPNYEYLFQKEEADRKKREEEERLRRAEIERQQLEEEERLYALYAEKKERTIISRRKRSEEKKLAREAQTKAYYEGVEISKGVFLGNRLAALNSEWLGDNGITHVMNVTKDLPHYYLDKSHAEDDDNTHPTSHVLAAEPDEPNTTDSGDNVDATNMDNTATATDTSADENKSEEGIRLRYRRFAIEDSRDEALPFEEIEAAVRFIQSAHTAGEGRALIHCREGKSRSVTVLLCYLMRAKHWPLQRAYTHVRERAPWINVNEGFLQVLMDIELRLFNSNSIDFFDKQDRKERVDYCEIDVEEQAEARRRTRGTAKKSETKHEPRAEVTPSASTAAVTPSDGQTGNVPSSETPVNVSSSETPVTVSSSETPVTVSSSETPVNVSSSETPVTSTETVAQLAVEQSQPEPMSQDTPHVSAATDAPIAVPLIASAVDQAVPDEQSEDKENSGDAQNVPSASVLGKRKREKTEAKSSPAKKKKKPSLPEPKVNIMSFFKRLE